MFEFKLPSLGADMDEGKLIEWKIKPGDQVKKGDIVAVIDTAKAAIDVESWQEGTVFELLVEPEATIPVGTVIATLLEAGETPEQAAKLKEKMTVSLPPVSEATQPEEIASPPIAPESVARHHRISPAARKRAETLGIAIETVVGTGPQGAVTIADVENAAMGQPSASKDKSTEMRRIIAAAMARSKREIPHYYLSEDVPLAEATAWLTQQNEQRPLPERLLLAPLLVKAVALALKRYPELNGFWQDDGFVPGTGIHTGIAISLRQGGLIAPAIRDADQKDLDTLMRELLDLVKRARAGGLRSSELSDATITITNLGDQGVGAVYGVIYPPQVALVGFGRVATRPWVVEDAIRAIPMVTASLSADHRISDGHRGGLFLAAVRENLQNPEILRA